MCKIYTILQNLFIMYKLHNNICIFEFMSNRNTIPIFESEITNWIPGQSIDCVIIGYDQQELHILVLKWKNTDKWSLPGGFIHKNEDMDKSALRILEDRTGIKFSFLDQFYTFGNKNRRDINELHLEMEVMGIDTFGIIGQWLKQRFITTGYLALVDLKKCHPKPDFLSDLCEWKSLSTLPKLIFDHNQIVKKALEHIRIQINYLPIGMSLLPSKFTMKELQKLYESVIHRKLDRGNFQKKILKLRILIRLEKQLTGGAHKAPYLYKFDEIKYEQLLKKGIGFMLS